MPTTHWHEVDGPLTSRQRKIIPHALRESDRNSPLLWLKLLEPGTDKVIRCRGRYDHIRASWIVQETPAEKNSVCGLLVGALAFRLNPSYEHQNQTGNIPNQCEHLKIRRELGMMLSES
ncbi:MAG: hypothetical protein P4M04_13890 [Acidobacteriota bacterium]|nr:hypothetical protein [Acidobacteriota bacterium]